MRPPMGHDEAPGGAPGLMRRISSAKERLYAAAKSAIKALGAVAALLLAASLVSALIPTSALADTGYWQLHHTGYITDEGGARVPTHDYWMWVDESGRQILDASDSAGNALNAQGYAATDPGAVPSWIPTGWTARPPVDIPPERMPTGDGEVIADSDPKILVDPDKAITKIVYSMVAGAANAALNLSAAFCSTIDVGGLFAASLDSGTYRQFYEAAVAIADKVALPYAYAFTGLVFIISMISIADMRRARMGAEQFGIFAEAVLAFTVTLTLIARSTDLMAAIYWIGLRLTDQVAAALMGLGIDPSQGLSQSFTGTFSEGIAQVTYEQFGNVFIYLIISIATVTITLGCVGYIFTTAFLRMTEIYLRCAFAPIPIAFFASEKTRPMGWSYLKRFAAVCFQAALIVCALALSSLLLAVARDLVAGFASDEGLVGMVKGVLPPIFALFAVTSILRKTEQVSAGLFGVG